MVKIGIVGGTGKMGLLFAKFFKKKGHEVLISHYDKAKALRIAKKHRLIGVGNEELVKSCDVIFFSVPIEKTVNVIKELAPLAKPGSLLSDFTSIKKVPIDAMLCYSNKKVEVIGLHPLFGPTVKSLKGETIAYVPTRGKRWLKWLKKTFEEEGAIMRRATAEEHDRMMAFVQGLVHFPAIASAYAGKKLGISFKKSMVFATPIYRKKVEILKKIFSQGADLYAGLEMHNPYFESAAEKFSAACKELLSITKGKSMPKYLEYFKKAADFLRN